MVEKSKDHGLILCVIYNVVPQNTSYYLDAIFKLIFTIIPKSWSKLIRYNLGNYTHKPLISQVMMTKKIFIGEGNN